MLRPLIPHSSTSFHIPGPSTACPLTNGRVCWASSMRTSWPGRTSPTGPSTSPTTMGPREDTTTPRRESLPPLRQPRGPKARVVLGMPARHPRLQRASSLLRGGLGSISSLTSLPPYIEPPSLSLRAVASLLPKSCDPTNQIQQILNPFSTTHNTLHTQFHTLNVYCMIFCRGVPDQMTAGEWKTQMSELQAHVKHLEKV